MNPRRFRCSTRWCAFAWRAPGAHPGGWVGPLPRAGLAGVGALVLQLDGPARHLCVLGVLGINIGYHRLLTHKGFVCPKWLERGFAFLGVCCLQGSPSRWVATHCRHHEHADDEPDPHSPILGFLWAHIGWVLVKNETMERGGLYRSYAKDILRDDFYAWIEDRKMWIWLVLMSWGVILWRARGRNWRSDLPATAVQFGLSRGWV